MQKWWLLGAGVIGVLLAVLLIRPPDTGGAIQATPTGNPVNFGDPAAPGTEAPAPTTSGTRDGRGPVAIAPVEERRGGNPNALRSAERRQEPDALAAGRLTGPWGAVRMQIGRIADAGQKEALQDLDTRIAEVTTQLRDVRRDPDGNPFEPTVPTQRALLEEVASSTIGEEIGVKSSVDRINEVLDEYEKAITE